MSVILVKMTAQNMLHVLILWGHREVSSVFVMLGTLELALLALVSLVTVAETNLYYFITFSDIDECSEGMDNCAVEAECTDTDGSFDCSCNAGFTGSGVNCSG